MVARAAVIGTGTMGSSIAVCLALEGIDVYIKDANEQALQQGYVKIDRILANLIRRDLPKSEATAIRERIRPLKDQSEWKKMDFAIEAVFEEILAKKDTIQMLDKELSADCVIASNTSSFSISQLASFASRPDRVIGMHFFNPAHIMRLVEVVPGLLTSEQTIGRTIAFGRQLDKLAVRVEECASFLVNRLLSRYANESIWCLQDGIAGPEEIDRAACELLMPVGPMALRDMNGLDVGLAVGRYNFQEYGERFRPPEILIDLVEKGQLGQKTLAGFFLYDAQSKKRIGENPEVKRALANLANKKASPSKFDARRLFLPMVNEAFLVLQEKICEPQFLDPAMRAGLNMREGPLGYANEVGLDVCLSEIERLFQEVGERFRPAPLLKRYVWSGKTKIAVD